MQDTSTAPTEQTPLRKLVRPTEGRWVGGVAAGLGAYFGLSPMVYRIAFAALALAGGAGLLLYIAAWLVIPDEGDTESTAERILRDHRDQPVLLIGVGVLAVAFIVALSHAEVWPNFNNLWTAVVIAGAALVWWGWQAGSASDPSGDDIVSSVEFRGTPAASSAVPATPAENAGATAPAAATATARARRRRRRKPVLFLPVVGVLAAAAGVLGILQLLDVVDVDWRIALLGAIVVVNLAIVGGFIFGRSVGGLIGVALLLGAALAVAVTIDVPIKGGIGTRVERPASAAELSSTYRLAVGQLELDLRNVQVPPGETHIDASVGIGKLLVTVPSDIDVEIDGHAGVGDLDLIGRNSNGVAADRTVRDTPTAFSSRKLVLTTDVGVGQVEVRRP